MSGNSDHDYPPFTLDELYAIDQATAAMETMMASVPNQIDKYPEDTRTRKQNLAAARKALVRIGFNED